VVLLEKGQGGHREVKEMENNFFDARTFSSPFLILPLHLSTLFLAPYSPQVTTDVAEALLLGIKTLLPSFLGTQIVRSSQHGLHAIRKKSIFIITHNNLFFPKSVQKKKGGKRHTVNFAIRDWDQSSQEDHEGQKNGGLGHGETDADVTIFQVVKRKRLRSIIGPQTPRRH
jgi:hypothetical protein